MLLFATTKTLDLIRFKNQFFFPYLPLTSDSWAEFLPLFSNFSPNVRVKSYQPAFYLIFFHLYYTYVYIYIYEKCFLKHLRFRDLTLNHYHPFSIIPSTNRVPIVIDSRASTVHFPFENTSKRPGCCSPPLLFENAITNIMRVTARYAQHYFTHAPDATYR